MSAVVRIAASGAYSPQEVLVWNGTDWVPTVPAGTATFKLALAFHATGASTTPGGNATFTMGLLFLVNGDPGPGPNPPPPPPPPPGPDGTVWLYTPPQWILVSQIIGALTSKVPVSTLVYRMNGTWVNQLGAYMDNPVVKNVDVDSDTGLLLYFDRPSVVPGSLHDELAAITTADSSWTDGTLIQL